MTKRLETEADINIQKCLKLKHSFAVIAGAGSGKTTSLITTLQYLRDTEGKLLRRNAQQIACITYTNRAVEVISSRLDWDELFLVSTLHAFLWHEIKRFTPNIRQALSDYIIPAKIAKKKSEDNGGKSKKAIKAREKITSLEFDLKNLEDLKKFDYADTSFSNYSQGQLNHNDVIDIAAYLISENEILRRILSQKYPYILVDEAQDTFENVVDAINKLCESPGLPIVGYFGDPMQQIYDKRAGNFSGPPDYQRITKEENFRCSRSVIRLLNSFRRDIQQFPAGINSEIEGSVSLRLVAAEKPEGKRNKYSEDQLERVSRKFDEALNYWGWDRNNRVKELFLVRQMIARRLGFSELQNLFTGQFASSKAQESYEKGDHFLLKPFVDSLCPLIHARKDNDFRQILKIFSLSSPTFDPIGVNAKKPLSVMKRLAMDLTQDLVNLWGEGTLGDVLRFCREQKLIRISERLSEHLDRQPRSEEYDANKHSSEKGDWLADNFLSMSTKEIEPFASFISENTPLSTQHGVKGEEYKNVLVMFDDIEAAWNNYSFSKTLTPNTSGVPTDGQQNRTKKLAYVCFSRAEENLRILLFTLDPYAAKEELISSGLFEENQISIAT
ncbi:MAG: UvrD-helicase domain-containing protein [Cyanobacteria bacterium P01_F01_bin.13]